MIHKLQLLTTPEEVRKVYDFINELSLDYPDYFQWVEKCMRELEIGSKHAFYATNLEGKVIGSAIFQQHKEEKQVLELKNLRVVHSQEQQGIGSILYELVELYAKEEGFRRIRGDAHSENSAVQFMIKRGYRIESKESLYTAKKEIILCKDV